MTGPSLNTDSGNTPDTDWTDWVLCDVHPLEHPRNPPDASPCVNARPAPLLPPRHTNVNRSGQ